MGDSAGWYAGRGRFYFWGVSEDIMAPSSDGCNIQPQNPSARYTPRALNLMLFAMTSRVWLAWLPVHPDVLQLSRMLTPSSICPVQPRMAFGHRAAGLQHPGISGHFRYTCHPVTLLLWAHFSHMVLWDTEHVWCCFRNSEHMLVHLSSCPSHLLMQQRIRQYEVPRALIYTQTSLLSPRSTHCAWSPVTICRNVCASQWLRKCQMGIRMDMPLTTL